MYVIHLIILLNILGVMNDNKRFVFVFVLFCIYTLDNLFPSPFVNQGGDIFWILSDSNVSLEEQIWLTECIYLADYFKLRKKKKKQNEMSFIITW